jgi:ankyrin repeat protein
MVRFLLDAGADPNATSNKGWNALIPASRNGFTKIIRILVEAGADVNCKTDQGRTALMIAAFWGDQDTVRALLDAGADVNKQDMDGDTVIRRALRSWKSEVGQMAQNDRGGRYKPAKAGWVKGPTHSPICTVP